MVALAVVASAVELAAALVRSADEAPRMVSVAAAAALDADLGPAPHYFPAEPAPVDSASLEAFLLRLPVPVSPSRGVANSSWHDIADHASREIGVSACRTTR